VKLRPLTLAALLLAAFPREASAGLLDSPPPPFPGGAPGLVVYRMGPIYFDPGAIDTVIRCTNTGNLSVATAIEVFDASDRLVGSAASAEVAAGAEVAFGTSNDASRPGLVVLGGLSPVAHGKARVSATAKTLSCIGHQVLRKADGTTREMQLELVKKVAY
jgi:hypothetical protein